MRIAVTEQHGDDIDGEPQDVVKKAWVGGKFTLTLDSGQEVDVLGTSNGTLILTLKNSKREWVPLFHEDEDEPGGSHDIITLQVKRKRSSHDASNTPLAF